MYGGIPTRSLTHRRCRLTFPPVCGPGSLSHLCFFTDVFLGYVTTKKPSITLIRRKRKVVCSNHFAFFPIRESSGLSESSL